jgi:hypothetical protein
MIEGCCSQCPAESIGTALTLSDAADWAQVAIAVFNAIFAIYLFWFQNRQNKEALKREVDNTNATLARERLFQAETLRRENDAKAKDIKLQWFKELILLPNIETFNKFFEELNDIQHVLITPTLDDSQSAGIEKLVSELFSKFKLNFLQPLQVIDASNPNFFHDIRTIVEDLEDDVTRLVLDETFVLNNSDEFYQNIGLRISRAKNNILIAIIKFDN